MLFRITVFAAFIVCLNSSLLAEDKDQPQPAELTVLKESIGVWDAEIEVWPQGMGSPSIKGKGVETNRAFGQHWIASDFDSTFMGQTNSLHAIVGYDLSKKKLVGTVIDHGPYSASMTGEYDAKKKAVTWTTKARTAKGALMVQRTVLTHKSPKERILVLKVPGKKKGEFIKFMEIKFTKRK